MAGRNDVVVAGSVVEASDNREIVISRVIAAPRAKIYAAWTTPDAGKWWGPRGFRTTTLEMDVKVGGMWRNIMHGPDGTDYNNRLRYSEVVPNEKLVYIHDDDGGGMQPFHATVTFEDAEGGVIGGPGTRVRLRMRFASAEERDRLVREVGAIEGGKQTLERLAEAVGG